MLSGHDALADFESASRRDWLLTDGLGGYAAGTASGAPTRRTHALLAVAAPQGAVTTLVLRCEERLAIGAGVHDLAAAFVAGRARAGAFAQLESFTVAPWPRWRWRFDDVVLERTIRVVRGHAAVVLSWRLEAGGPVRLSVAPLLTARAPRGLRTDGEPLRGVSQGIPGRARIETFADQPGVTLWHNGGFMPARDRVRALGYPLEFATEDDGTAPEVHEDGFLAGWVQAELASPGTELHVVLSPEEGLFRALASEGRLGTPPARTLRDCIAAIDRSDAERRDGARRLALAGADLTARQAAAAHGGDAAAIARRPNALVDDGDGVARCCASRVLDALVSRHGRMTLGGRWPGDPEDGAATLRAAAALVTLRAFEPARAIAMGYLDYLDEGLAPARFDASGQPEYDGPDTSLWLVHLVDLLARRGSVPPQQDEFLCDVAWPALEGVLQHLRAGARGGVHCDADGLLWTGEGDAARAPAGTNALWYHALVAMAQMGKLLGRRENAAFYLAWAHALQRRYPDAMWDDGAGGLYEALAPGGPCRGVSPAQLWAVALPPSLLPAGMRRRLMLTLDRELLVADGLRERPDDAHASAAWLGPWATATLRASGRSPVALARVTAALARAGAADPIEPLAAAEVLRAWVEEGDRAEQPLFATR